MNDRLGGQDISSGQDSGSSPAEGGETVPVVKWKAKMPVDSSSSPAEDLEEDPAPKRKWKVRQVPSSSGNGTTEDELERSGHHATAQGPQQRAQNRQGNSETVPVVKWKARVPVDDDDDEDESPSDVPVVKWKAKMPQENSDVPVVKWKAKMPAEDTQNDDIPVVRRKAKKPDEAIPTSDVPVVKWKAKVPDEGQNSDVPVVRKTAGKKAQISSEEDDVPVVKWKARMPQDGQNSVSPGSQRRAVKEDDVPVVKWKARVPQDGSPSTRKKAQVPAEEDDVPVVKWKARMPQDGQNSLSPGPKKKAAQEDDVPVVTWKARVPQDEQNSVSPGTRRKAQVPTEEDDVPVVKWKAKMPQQEPSAPAARRKARMPEDNQNSDDPVVNRRVKAPSDPSAADPSDNLRPQEDQRQAHSPRGVRKARKVARVPAEDLITSTEVARVRSPREDLPPTLPEPVTPPLSPPLSPIGSPAHQTQDDEPYKPKKPVSRHASFSESRSPSPPSISPHVRMAIASPVLSRRTPSPSRSSLTASLGSLSSRQSPSASPIVQARQLQQYMSGGGLGAPQQQQNSPASSRSFTGSIPSPGSGGSKLRTPRSKSTGVVKTNAPMKGLTPPGERKKRMLPPSPDSGRSRSRERTNKRAQHLSPQPAQR